MQTGTRVRPFNQHLRIWALRLLFLAMLPLLLMVEPRIASQFVREGMEPLGVLLIVAGVLGRFWSILYIGGRKNRQVVQDGPYSMCRHPLYFFSTVGILGFGLLTRSITLTLAIAITTFAILALTARREEKYLREQFGPAYAAYAARVPLILPNPRLFQSPPEVTFATADLRTNLQDALVFLSLFPLMELLEYFQADMALPRIPLW